MLEIWKVFLWYRSPQANHHRQRSTSALAVRCRPLVALVVAHRWIAGNRSRSHMMLDKRTFAWVAGINWPTARVSFKALDDIDVSDDLMCKTIISSKDNISFTITEKYSIANCLQPKNTLFEVGMVIHPTHRNAYGMRWCDIASICHRSDHDANPRGGRLDCRVSEGDNISTIVTLKIRETNLFFPADTWHYFEWRSHRA